jgi:P27 family predicted phage terminase small subunit
MRGRPRKPTALKILQGKPGHRALPKGEVQPKVGCVPPPWLGLKARAEWSRLAPRLIELGLLTEVDGDAFAGVCLHTVRLATLAKIQDSLTGAEVVLDAAALADCTKELRQLWSRFGMTPADRSRVTVVPPKEKDEFGALFG